MKALIIDTRNMQYAISRKYDIGRLDYKKLIADRKIAVGLEYDSEEANNFVNFLRMLHFEVKFPKSLISFEGELRKTLQNEECNVLLISEIFRIANKADHIIICSQNKTLLPIVKLLKANGIYVEILGVGIPTELRRACDLWVEVDSEDLIKSNQA